MNRFFWFWTLVVVLFSGCGEHGSSENIDAEDAPADSRFEEPPLPSTPIEPSGAGRWRDSENYWVSANLMIDSTDIWSDDQAIYLLSIQSDDPDTAKPTVYRNDGSGWKLWAEILDSERAMPSPGLTGGFDDGLLVYGAPGTYHLSNGKVTEFQDFVDNIYVVNNSLAYGTYRRDRKIARNTGDGWEPVPADAPYDVFNVWADETTLIAVGSGGTLLSCDGKEWTTHDSGTLDDLFLVWRLENGEVWASSLSGALHHYLLLSHN